MNGWNGLAIDGDERNYEEMKKNRKTAVCAVVSDKEDEVDFWRASDDPDLSGLVKLDGNGIEGVRVRPVKLEKILEDNKIDKVHLLSIDTEGTEKDVWRSFDYMKHKPDIVVIEFITQGKVTEGLGEFFKGYDYAFRARIGPNLIFFRNWRDDKHD